MRTDVKIGLALGLVLLVIIIVYFAAKDVAPQAGPSGQGLAGPETQPRPKVVKVALKSEEPKRKPVISPVEPARPRILSLKSFGPRPVTTRPIAPKTSATKPAPKPPVPPETAGRLETPGPTIVPIAVQRAAGKPQIYVVQAGDYRGFWGVAEKVYGDGKYYRLIAQANPGVDPHKLRPGKKLVIPPLPKKEQARPVQRRTGGAERTYTVRKGDGLWIIAQKVYGHGKHWPRIAEANPGVNINALPVGKKLIIPPLTARPGQKAAKTAPPSVGVGRTYTVQSGDKGFWGIAEKVYGDGKYGPLIARANPGVDSDSLRPGQVLSVPVLTVEARSSLPKAPRSQPLPPKEDDRPVFD